MTKRLLLRWSVALLVVVGTWTTHGAAAQTVAELRALSCCAHDCGHRPARTADPSGCCGVAPSPAAVSAAPAAPLPAPTLVAALLGAAATTDPPASRIAAPRDLAAARAAPVFLLTRSLRN